MKLAVFDIDGTLIRGASERLFWRYLLRRGRLGPRQIFAFLLFMIRYLPTGGIQTPRKNKAYLTGLRVEDIEALARDFVAEKLMSRLQQPVLQRLEQHLRRGDIVVLMSGTLLPIARALADALRVPHVCATLTSQRNGVFLAQPPEIHPYDAAKLSLVQQLAAEFKIDMRHVAAYGDSKHDIFLLSSVGEPVAVYPDQPLLAAALENNWEILSGRPAEDVLHS
ncbi:MAG TPA: HAD-IB family hydrolase [Gammaproteobacteria bacterium]|nr:HAD-IB family hydrolase [Gammaproteobacteria bacterium]